MLWRGCQNLDLRLLSDLAWDDLLLVCHFDKPRREAANTQFVYRLHFRLVHSHALILHRKLGSGSFVMENVVAQVSDRRREIGLPIDLIHVNIIGDVCRAGRDDLVDGLLLTSFFAEVRELIKVALELHLGSWRKHGHQVFFAFSTRIVLSLRLFIAAGLPASVDLVSHFVDNGNVRAYHISFALDLYMVYNLVFLQLGHTGLVVVMQQHLRLQS